MLKGTGVAVVTPFLNGEVDFAGLEKVLAHIIEGGVEFVVMLGTTGEAATLDKSEKHAVLDFTTGYVNGRIPVIAGFGGNNTREVIHAIEDYHFKGISGILSVSPYYSKPTQEGIFQHFMAIEKASPVPIIIYNVPSRTASNVTAETTLRLAEASSKFIATKEASGDFRQVMDIINRKPDDFIVLSGDDNITLPLMALGAKGVISVVGNAFPGTFSDMVRACLRDDFVTARQLHYSLVNLTDMLFVDGNPAGVKAALDILGICSREVRLPLVPVRDETWSKLERMILGFNATSHDSQRSDTANS